METVSERPRAAAGFPSGGPRILELGLMPLVSTAFPERTTFLDTRLRWADVRTVHPVPAACRCGC